MTFSIAGSARVRRIVKDTPKRWTCECPAPRDDYDLGFGLLTGRDRGTLVQPAYLSRCPDCGTRRP